LKSAAHRPLDESQPLAEADQYARLLAQTHESMKNNDSTSCRQKHRTGVAPAALYLLFAAATLIASSVHANELGRDLPGLLEHARQQNAELALMRAEAEAARQRVQPAGALPDPTVRVELMDVTNEASGGRFSLLPSKVGETRYTVMQMFPAWGKRDLRREAAAAGVDEAQHRTAAAWSELSMRIKSAYARYYAAAGNEQLTREILDLMKRIEQIAQARYAGGLVSQQDPIRAQIEQTTMRSELIMLQAEKDTQRARLNALLSRSPAALLAEPRELRPLPDPAVLDLASLADRARRSSPLVLAEEARLRGAQKNRELAQRNGYPDFSVGVQPTQMGSKVANWGVMLEMNVPLQRETRRSERAEAQAMVDAARARTDNVISMLGGELGESVAGLHASRRTADLVTTQSLPQSELGLRSAIAAYENGRLEFTALLEAQRQIRKVRQDRLRAAAEAQMRLAEIERLIGEEL
jgi:cobalt-zinc-cadmium efflux system outer membrane protein